MVLGGGRRGLRGGRRARRGGRATWRRAGARERLQTASRQRARARARRGAARHGSARPCARRHGRSTAREGRARKRPAQPEAPVTGRGRARERVQSACPAAELARARVAPARAGSGRRGARTLRGAGGRAGLGSKAPARGQGRSRAAAARCGKCAGVAPGGNAHEPACEATPRCPLSPAPLRGPPRLPPLAPASPSFERALFPSHLPVAPRNGGPRSGLAEAARGGTARETAAAASGCRAVCQPEVRKARAEDGRGWKADRAPRSGFLRALFCLPQACPPKPSQPRQTHKVRHGSCLW